eukprot:EG_transcript_18975
MPQGCGSAGLPLASSEPPRRRAWVALTAAAATAVCCCAVLPSTTTSLNAGALQRSDALRVRLAEAGRVRHPQPTAGVPHTAHIKAYATAIFPEPSFLQQPVPHHRYMEHSRQSWQARTAAPLVVGLVSAGVTVAVYRIWGTLRNLLQPGAAAEVGEGGKLERIEAVGGIGPPGLLVAVADPAVLETLRGVAWRAAGTPVPVLQLGTEDIVRQLQDILADLPDRDGVRPDSPLTTAHPLIIFSGLEPAQVQQAVALLSEAAIPMPMLAMAVPRALEKPLGQLVGEIQGDFEAHVLEETPEMLG